MPKKPIIVNKLSDHGYPYHDKNYKTAHEEASKAEKKKFPKGYRCLKKMEQYLSKNELMGTNKKSGKIEVEKKYKKYAKEIGYHEQEEHKNLERLDKKSKK
jgi:hypothetical protein